MITLKLLLKAQSEHQDSCNLCSSGVDIDCLSAQILDRLEVLLKTDFTPNGQPWVCRADHDAYGYCTSPVGVLPGHNGCGPVPPAPSSDTPSDERPPVSAEAVAAVAEQAEWNASMSATPSPDPAAAGEGTGEDDPTLRVMASEYAIQEGVRKAREAESARRRAGEGTERPDTDAEQLRAAADWFDTFDKMGRAFFAFLARSTMSDEMRAGAEALIPTFDGDEVQTDLRRIADRLDALTPQPPVPPQGTERPDTDTLRKIGAGTDGDGITLLTRAERAFLARAADWIDAHPAPSSSPVGDRGLEDLRELAETVADALDECPLCEHERSEDARWLLHADDCTLGAAIDRGLTAAAPSPAPQAEQVDLELAFICNRISDISNRITGLKMTWLVEEMGEWADYLAKYERTEHDYGLEPGEFVSRPCDLPKGEFQVLHMDTWRDVKGAWTSNTTRHICRVKQ